MVVRNDLVRRLLDRLGMAGAILIASALIFGAIGGGVVVHRLQATPSASSSQQENDGGVDEQTQGPSKNKHANHGHHSSPESEDTQDKDA